MTTYTAILAGEIDSDSPITDTLLARLRDNPIAIAEGDATVPVALLQTRLLGTLTTTSGSVQSLTSLNLTPYKFLLLVLNGVGRSASGGNHGLGTATNIFEKGSADISGLCLVELSTGLAIAMTAVGSTDGIVKVDATGYTTATTTVSVNTSGHFNAGSVTVYGVK